jgi:hypothetical protein
MDHFQPAYHYVHLVRQLVPDCMLTDVAIIIMIGDESTLRALCSLDTLYQASGLDPLTFYKRLVANPYKAKDESTDDKSKEAIYTSLINNVGALITILGG